MIKNTSKNRNPEWLFGLNPNAIENQEKEGQNQLVGESTAEVSQLPAKCSFKSDPKEMYAKLGFTVIGESEGDDLFLDVKMTDGWKIESTDHSMWSNLVDENGSIRAKIFYKAAFYDRDAFISDLIPRYQITYDYQEDTKTNGFDQFVRVKDNKTGEILFERDGLVDRYKMSKDEIEKTCLDFLNKNFPNWKDPIFYWDTNK